MAPTRRRLRAVPAPPAPAVVRAAIYTRKSTAAGLDANFTSLDNQRERAEAYIDSQRDQGWTVVPTAYNDGGFSGGNIDRPALQRLVEDVRAGQLDAIVVYRLDRLSRSLVDFGRVHEFLEKHNVALVSVSESINTSTPHGRMMVNVLLSFAQYERELVAERTSHKIQAARRKGQWTGGHPSLGFDIAPEGGKLIVNKDEATVVRQIFAMYVENQSLIGISQELNRRGWHRKTWTTRTGKTAGGGAWDRKTLSNFLRDPTVVGKIRLGDEIFKGEHKGIVPKALFDKVQRLLDANHRDRGASTRNRHGALLRGRIRCSACRAAMTFAPARRGGRVYRYYRCSAAGRNGHGTCPTRSVNADKVEQFVVDQIRRIGSDPALQEETFQQAVAQVKAQRRGLKLEQRRQKADLSASRADVQRLVETVSRLTGPAADATAAELGAAQERVTNLKSRRSEIKTELATLDVQAIDRTELARALEAFDPIWDVLLAAERERVLQLLIERIDYDGSVNQLDIAWRLAGFGQLAKEIGP